MELETELEAVTSAPRDMAPESAAPFDAWVSQSRSFAREEVYLRGTLRAGSTPTSAIVLTPAYTARARQVATTQLARAGHRIAALLLDLGG